MKKALAYFFAMLIILLFSSIFLISCKAKLPPDVNTEIVKQKDSFSHIQNIDHSKAIIDSLCIYIGQIKTTKPECDSVTQLAIENLLRTLNTSKKSGDNGYEIKYNELKKRLDLVIKIGATKNEVTKDFTLKDKFRDRFITKTITIKEPLAKWQMWLMVIGIGTILFLIIKLLYLIKNFIPA
jgi:hypothetical protein